MLIGLDPLNPQDKQDSRGTQDDPQQAMSGALLDSAQLQNETLPMEITPSLLVTQGDTNSVQDDETDAGLVKVSSHAQG